MFINVLHIIALSLCYSFASAGSCLSSNARDPDSPVNIPYVPPSRGLTNCRNPRPAQGWHCFDPALTFPTIDCLIADMRACGNVGTGPTIFYSFRQTIDQPLKNFKASFNPPGVMFNDALDDAWFEEVVWARRTEWGMGGNQSPRDQYYVGLYAAALAQASTGEVFLAIPERYNQTGRGEPGGAYRLTFDGMTNVWRAFEFPILQRNPAITAVTSVDFSDNLQRTTDWRPNDGNEILPAPQLVVPPQQSDTGMETGLCAPDPISTSIGLSTITVSAITTTRLTLSSPVVPTSTVSPVLSTTSVPISTITSAPALNCQLKEADPDQGIDSAYCTCDGSLTLAPFTSLPPGASQADSCAYKTVPNTSAQETITVDARTYTSSCQACTQIQFNAPSCTPIAGCVKTQAQAQIQAGSSPVHVGTLTGTALYTSISQALETLCPPVSQTTTSTTCATTGVSIPNVAYVGEEFLDTDGTLEVKVEASGYNVTSLRDAMIHSLALTAQQSSSDSKNCYEKNYLVEESRRDVQPSRFSPLRPLGLREHPYTTHRQIKFCNTVSFAAAQYYNEFWRLAPQPGPTNFIYADWQFHTGPEGDFVCDFLAGLADLLVTVAPEFAVEDVALGEEIKVTCEEAIQNGLTG